MQTYLALLRGINVGGQKKIKMSRLKEMMVKLGFVDVQTYIQSGNLVFKYQQTKSDGIADIIKSGIAGEFGHDVEVLVLDRKTFKNIIEKSPYSVADGLDKKLLYYVFLIDPPEQEAAKQLSSETFDGEEFSISNECVFLHCFAGYGKAKCNNNFFEKRLHVRATARNYNTVNTLLDLSS